MKKFRPKLAFRESERIEGETSKVQILRSVGRWSAGVDTEASILPAAEALIREAKHFVYIENQFFVSKVVQEDEELEFVVNKVGMAIVERVSRAIEEGKPFKVFMLIPQHFQGNIKHKNVRAVMRLQYKCIFGENSILSVLKKRHPNTDISQFLSFNSLRNFGKIGKNTLTEQIYIHSKLVLVDDLKVLIGSVCLS